MKKRAHIRSASCDVKIGRSNSRDYDQDNRNRRLFQPRSHSRNNSRDLDFDSRHRRQPTHSRTNSRDNIKYILNCLKPDNRLLLTSAAMMAQAAAAEHGTARPIRKHSRNHSYDQIYTPNNIKIDQELHRFHKNRAMAATTSTAAAAPPPPPPPVSGEHDLNALITSAINNANKDYLDNKLLNKTNMEQHQQQPSSTVIPIGSHSRTNSKDLNKCSFLSSLVDDAANNILRHRRTNSKDLNRILNTAPSTSMASIGQSNDLLQSQTQTQFHRRNVSLTKNELAEEMNTNDGTQVLLLGNNEHSDTNEHNNNELE